MSYAKNFCALLISSDIGLDQADDVT